ncbi:hypothetical protein B0H67DRAFT_606814 [Lasiosphaeris hirsuta]|uniref:Uncharacterized protein n=1 Tax=Lasiosphaeris hirsuta TaxID=260670 RepID=A0AA40E219_9PEZI|nr:hypothetical protein B0H67DRAFT_606814 [Lasiosphaeris hirsuta]
MPGSSTNAPTKGNKGKGKDKGSTLADAIKDDNNDGLFTPREREIIVSAMLSTKEWLVVEYAELAKHMGFANVRSASNAWAAIKKKIVEFHRKEGNLEFANSISSTKKAGTGLTGLRSRPLPIPITPTKSDGAAAASTSNNAAAMVPVDFNAAMVPIPKIVITAPTDDSEDETDDDAMDITKDVAVKDEIKDVTPKDEVKDATTPNDVAKLVRDSAPAPIANELSRARAPNPEPPYPHKRMKTVGHTIPDQIRGRPGRKPLPTARTYRASRAKTPTDVHHPKPEDEDETKKAAPRKRGPRVKKDAAAPKRATRGKKKNAAVPQEAVAEDQVMVDGVAEEGTEPDLIQEDLKQEPEDHGNY